MGRFGITGKSQTQPILQLSDGLRSRLVFAWLAYKTPHILALVSALSLLLGDLMSSAACFSAASPCPSQPQKTSHTTVSLSDCQFEVFLNGNAFCGSFCGASMSNSHNMRMCNDSRSCLVFALTGL